MREPLSVLRFSTSQDFDRTALAETLTNLKRLASRTPTPVTPEQLEVVLRSPDCMSLFLQLSDDQVVGWCAVTVSLFEDRAYLGPVAVFKEGEHTGYGTPLVETAIADTWQRFPGVRRIDLTNRSDHDHDAWYRKFGFIPRTEAEGDAATVYRLARP